MPRLPIALAVLVMLLTAESSALPELNASTGGSIARASKCEWMSSTTSTASTTQEEQEQMEELRKEEVLARFEEILLAARIR